MSDKQKALPDTQWLTVMEIRLEETNNQGASYMLTLYDVRQCLKAIRALTEKPQIEGLDEAIKRLEISGRNALLKDKIDDNEWGEQLLKVCEAAKKYQGEV